MSEWIACPRCYEALARLEAVRDAASAYVEAYFAFYSPMGDDEMPPKPLVEPWMALRAALAKAQG